MTARRSPGPWRAAQISIRGHKVWAVRNSHRDPVAVVYTTEADAELLAAAPKLLGCLKHLIAIVRLIPNLRASAKAKLADAEALVASINH